VQYAIVNSVREVPSPGAVGACSACGARTVAKCGPKVVWHWAHAGKKHCDPWWENETQWHKDWKALFPEECREVVRFDQSTGEKHVADVLTKRGLVIELQNSPMPLAELQSREAFYKRMIWIVNGEGFREKFHVLHALPDPGSAFAEDLAFCATKHNQPDGLFWRLSENPGSRSMVEMHSMQTIAHEIRQNYRGHHLFEWLRPRSVWFDAIAPVFIDDGSAELLWLKPYDSRGLWCVQRVQKARLIAKNGGLSTDLSTLEGGGISYEPSLG
jgi:competence protein CoiA